MNPLHYTASHSSCFPPKEGKEASVAGAQRARGRTVRDGSGGPAAPGPPGRMMNWVLAAVGSQGRQEEVTSSDRRFKDAVQPG